MTVKEHNILHPCSCGSQNVEPFHIIDVKGDPNFSIWIKCTDCNETTEFSYRSYLDAADGWNKKHKK